LNTHRTERLRSPIEVDTDTEIPGPVNTLQTSNVAGTEVLSGPGNSVERLVKVRGVKVQLYQHAKAWRPLREIEYDRRPNGDIDLQDLQVKLSVEGKILVSPL
jgi:hypothetical protein